MNSSRRDIALELLIVGVALASIFIQFAMVQLSPYGMSRGFCMLSAFAAFRSILLISLPMMLLFVFVSRLWICQLATSLFYAVFSIFNYAVSLYHGSPISFTALRSLKTAMNVSSGYGLPMTSRTALIFVLLSVLLILCAALFFMEKRYGKRWLAQKRRYRVVLLVVCVLASSLSLCGDLLGKRQNVINWSWKDSVELNGYPVTLLCDGKSCLFPMHKPEGYDEREIVCSGSDIAQGDKPDIIVIVNEAFFDLNEYADVVADVDYMQDFYGIENAIYGHAICSQTGGGTNNTEFELLTSISMGLLNSDAPFNFVDLPGIDGSIPRYAKSLGYSTTAFHTPNAKNYKRETGYPDLGFDQAYFGSEKAEMAIYGNRLYTDETDYEVLIDEYEERLSQDSGPKLSYLLTFQNHGGYEQNDESLDTVHANEDLGDLTDDVNEYMTSVSMGCSAFRGLTEYFSQSDRPVLIVMVGDHAPSIISELPRKEGISDEEADLLTKSVPFAVWSNFEIDERKFETSISMVSLMPTALQKAGLPLTGFQKAVLQMTEDFPVVSSDGTCVAKSGELSSYDPNNMLYSKVTAYLGLAYSELSHDEKYCKDNYVLISTD